MSTMRAGNRQKINAARLENEFVMGAFEDETTENGVVRPLSDATEHLLGSEDAEIVRFGGVVPGSGGTTPLSICALTATGMVYGTATTGAKGRYEVRWLPWRRATTWGLSGQMGFVRGINSTEDRPRSMTLTVKFLGLEEQVELPVRSSGLALRITFEESQWILAQLAASQA